MNRLKPRRADLFHIDLDALNLSKSTLGTATMLVALILFSTIGAFGFTVALGAALAISYDTGGPKRRRIAAIGAFAVTGALATLLGNAAGQSAAGSVAALFVVTLGCGLGLAFGPLVGRMALFINIWMVIALSLSSVLYEPVLLALGFLCGSGLVAAALLTARTKEPEASEATASAASPWSLAALRVHLSLHSSIMQFALSRALAAAFTAWFGWQLGLAHPYWIAMTLLIVVVPDRQQAARTIWQRAAGSVIGVAIGAAVLALHPPQITLLLLWLLIVLLMLAVQEANYTAYVALLTWNLILFYRLIGADVVGSGAERLLTTLLGIVCALGVLVLLDYLARRSESA
jgi:hypothetical protein